jgi:hypothetical protein
MNDFGRKKFKEFAKANRLRLKTAEDGNPVVVSRGKKYLGCQLYEGFNDDYVGLYVTRGSAAKLKHTTRMVKKMGLNPTQEGDLEVIFRVPYSKVWKIAKAFNMVKKRPSNQNMDGLNKWRANNKEKDETSNSGG